jgi:hypothetical protein
LKLGRYPELSRSNPSLFTAVSDYDHTFYDRFTLRTYPWDAGTDEGTSYTSAPSNQDPPLNVERIYVENAPISGDFLSPDKKNVHPVGEFDCVLQVCPPNLPDCQRADWPPVNYCDVLKYPKCASYCDPKTVGTSGGPLFCTRCKGNPYEPKSVYLTIKDCCNAGHDPWGGQCSAAFTVSSWMCLVLTGAALVLLSI